MKFDPATGKQFKGRTATKSYTTYFAEALISEAEVDEGLWVFMQQWEVVLE